MSSSIRRVAIGSRAEHGSSIKRTVGSVAIARAMHRRCCWPPDNDNPLAFSLSFTSSQRAARLSEPTASLSILIYNFSSMPFDNQIELAWAASLILVLIVLVFNILSRWLGRPKY